MKIEFLVAQLCIITFDNDGVLDNIFICEETNELLTFLVIVIVRFVNSRTLFHACFWLFKLTILAH